MSEAKTSGDKTLAPGEKIAGRYKVLESLPQGGEGSRRYRVQDDQAGAQTLILTQSSLAAGQDKDKTKRALERALRAMSWIRHAGVIVPRDIFLEEDSVYSVTPEALGVPLEEYVRQQAPPLASLAKLANELASMLDQLHESRNPYFLGKLPPANILVQAEGQPLLVGFELGADLKVEYRPAEESPDFTAPDTKYDARSDVYCLGKLLSQAIEWSADSVRKAYKEEADLRTLVNQMVADAPEKRIPSMATLKTRLERLKWKDAPKPKATSVTDAPIKVHTVQEKTLWQSWVEEYRVAFLGAFLALIVLIFFLTLLFPGHD